jgi:hypothetical protein
MRGRIVLVSVLILIVVFGCLSAWKLSARADTATNNRVMVAQAPGFDPNDPNNVPNQPGGPGMGPGGPGGNNPGGGYGGRNSGGTGGNRGGFTGGFGGGASVSANAEFVYVVRGSTLYQFSAKDLALVRKTELPAPTVDTGRTIIRT